MPYPSLFYYKYSSSPEHTPDYSIQDQGTYCIVLHLYGKRIT